MSLVAWLRPAVAVLVTAAAGGLGVVFAAGPAPAAPCPGSAGVTVVVEHGALGGGIEQSCAAEGGGHTADRALKDTGHALTYLQRFPAFVCRIDGVPADDPCVNTPPADAYWGLWWSDGESGEWAYSSLAAGSLTVPAGGYVAMVWDGSTGNVRPQTGAPAHPTPAPTPTTRKPSPTPTTSPTPTVTATGPATGEPTTGPTARPGHTKKPRPSKSPTASHEPSSPDPSTEPTGDEQTGAAGPIDDPTDPSAADDGGLPAWVGPVVVVVLLGAAGCVALIQRRGQP